MSCKTENDDQDLAIEIYKIARTNCQDIRRINSLFSEKLKFRSQHTNYVSYNDVISCDVT